MKKLFLIIILAIASAPGVRAQEPQVEFALDPIDVSARTMQRLDLHGEKCALVKVRVLGSDVSFRGSVMGDVKKDGSEYWVYMPGNTKMLQISSETFLPFRYNFPEPLRGGSTYVLTIHTPQAAQPQRRKENFLVLKVSPANAHVYVDGTERPVEDGIVSVPLADGPHTYRAEAIGYAPVSGSVTMAGERVARTVALVSNKPTLTVTAAADATEIYVNDVRRGAGSWNGELVPGDYIVEGRLTGHRTNTQKVTLSEGQNRTVTIPALEAITGSLSVTYKPVDATITIDGRAAGVTPNVFNDLAVGTHTVTISAPGYTPATHTITLSESSPSTLTGTLAPAPVTMPALTAAPSSNYSIPTLDDIALTDKYEHYFNPVTHEHGFKLNGTIVIPATNHYTELRFSEGLVAAMTTKGKWGFLDKTGSMVIPAIYNQASQFKEGLAKVKIKSKYGFIDKTGALVIPAIYDDARSFSNETAEVSLKKRKFYIDRHGNEVDANTPAETSLTPAADADPYDADIALTSQYKLFKEADKCGYKYNDKVVIPAIYDLWDKGLGYSKYDKAREFSEGLALVRTNGKYGYIDKNGTMVIPAKYADAWQFDGGIAQVKIKDKWGFIDKFDKVVIPAKYDFAASFTEGRSKVKIDGKWGYIDKSGAIVIPIKYDSAYQFENGKARVELNGRQFFIDRNGNEVQ